MAGSEYAAPEKVQEPSQKTLRIVYFNVAHFLYWHVAGLYGLYLAFTSAKWATISFAFLVFVAGDIGITAGAHRLWAHRSYRAKLPLQVLLMLFQSIAFQNTAIRWARDHRMHHRYVDTDADPHNRSRGFFFSHIGWLLVRKHPKAFEKIKSIDISDLEENPVLQFQKKHVIPLVVGLSFVVPTLVPLFWGESLNNAYHVTVCRYMLSLNGTFLVNSMAHMWGPRPYDTALSSTQSWPTIICTLGEGFHNYHHVFPWDYRAAELGNEVFNITTKFIDFFAWVGWAYDLKTVPPDVIRRRADRNGDGSLKAAEVDDKYAKVLNPACAQLSY